MKDFKQKIIQASVIGSLFAASIVQPTFASISVRISGNGSGSDNSVSIHRNASFSVSQSNTADIENVMHIFANTGRNHVSGNTDGRFSVHTGSIHTWVDILNFLNFNFLRFNR